jgi:predicted unusual protein kinase regulating ubiquinone biosynthesis (AarF/ABC1/UbiB family)
MYRHRYNRILWFFARVLISLLWWDIFLPAIGIRTPGKRNRTRRLQRIARNFRAMATEMGGVMIKVGQFLSSRLDVLPRVVTDELTDLQDEVSPETFENVRRVIESEFGEPLEARFAWFEEAPMASASIGQVHRARLRAAPDVSEDTPVVVKVQRLDIPQIVDVDLRALRVVGRWVQHYPTVGKRANVPALIEEFSRSLYEEIDYLLEGKHAETFKENFIDRPEVRVPQVHWSHTTRRVLTLEDVQDIKITDYAAIEAAGISRADIANQLFDVYLKQIFEDCFFHADPHPGNLFVSPIRSEDPEEPPDWRLVFVDFGMVGEVTPKMQAGLKELIVAIGLRDTKRVIKSYQMLDILLPGADLELLEKAGTRVFERFYGKTAPEMMALNPSEAAEFINDFSDLIYEMPFQIPENFILLGRCVSILSGICSGLNPDFNIWTSIIPYAEKLLQGEQNKGWKFWVGEAGAALRPLITLPGKTENLLERIEQGRLEIRTPDMQHQLTRVDRSVRRLTAAVIFAAFLLAAVQIYLSGNMILAGGLSFAALLALGASIFQR